jgi:predicted metal-dependent phosphoesterase TrpH
MIIDLHTHSAVSDGTDSVPELIDAASAAGIGILALTDHDTMDGVDLAQDLGAQAGIEVLRGMELSTHIDADSGIFSVHLLAYGCLSEDPEIIALLEALRQARTSRVPRMLEHLTDMGMPVTIEEVQAQSSSASVLGRPHIADAMVVKGYVKNRTEAFDAYLSDTGPAYVRRYTPSVAEALDIIAGAGGVGVLAHPWGRGNQSRLTTAIIAELSTNHGLAGIEVDHTDHGDLERQVLRSIVNDLGLVATGSSDYHGTGKANNPLAINRTTPDAYELLRSEIERRGGRP